MKTKKLKYTPEYNFELLGISCSDDDYQLSWYLSKLLTTEFVRTADLEIRDSRYPEFQMFSVYESVDFAENSSVKIVSNKANVGFLIEELKNIDYFILVFESEDSNFMVELTARLKTVQSISAVFKLKPENLKSKEKLLF